MLYTTVFTVGARVKCYSVIYNSIYSRGQHNLSQFNAKYPQYDYTWVYDIDTEMTLQCRTLLVAEIEYYLYMKHGKSGLVCHN